MFAIRARRKMATEKDFLEAVEKVVRQGSKFSSTGLYAQVSRLPCAVVWCGQRLTSAFDACSTTERRSGERALLYCHALTRVWA